MRPHRTVVIGKRIVAGLGAGAGPNAPSGEGDVAHQSLSHAPASLGGGDSGEQAMSGVGGAHPARLLAAVERQGIGSQVAAPEPLLELCPQRFSLEFKLAALILVA